MLLPLNGCRAQQPWPLWESYTSRFLDTQGRIIDRSATGAQHDRTTSEGQAYALFFALVDNDRAHFDQILSWTEANLAGGDLTLRLPAWDWGQSGGQWKTLDENSASDADLWITYTLLEAGRLWHDPRLSSLGKLLAQRIAREEIALVPGVGTTLLPGPHGFHPDEQTWILNPSYMPPQLLAYMAHFDPQGPWSAVLESLPALLDPGVGHGFAMDWVSAGASGVHAAPPPLELTAGQREAQPSGSYDAIRVYLWLGLADPGTAGVRDLERDVSGMGAYLRTSAVPPLEVQPDGSAPHADAPVGFSAAVLPYLENVGLNAAATAQADRLTATRDPGSGLLTNVSSRGADYYDQNLALFSTAWAQQRFRFTRDGKLRVTWK